MNQTEVVASETKDESDLTKKILHPNNGVQANSQSDKCSSIPLATTSDVQQLPVNDTEKVVGGNSEVFRRYMTRLGFAWAFKKSLWPTIMKFVVLLSIFAGSFVCVLVVWFTDLYNRSIINNLILANGSQAAKWWQSPPIDPQLRVYIFNYTNTRQWLDGEDDKLHIHELGPYVYKEFNEKVNVIFNDNNTISYREKRRYEFLPNESTGKQYDTVVFPNVLYRTVLANLLNVPLFLRSLLQTLTSINPIFQTAQADKMLWGYDDQLYTNVVTFTTIKGPRQFGMLATRNGIGSETLTINNGVDDIAKLSIIDVFNGMKKLQIYSTDECNRVDGTDGSQFPPHLLDKKHTLYVFAKAFCRRFPLKFDQEDNILDGIPILRYKAPIDVFAHPDEKPENQCYCNLPADCPPSGVFDVSKCFDAPIMISYPHFYAGNKSLLADFEGLNPREDLHRSYADIHPRLAFPIAGASRIQINVQFGNELKHPRFNETKIMPVLWMELTSGIIPEELRATIYHSTFSTNAIELSLRYGSLLIAAMSLALLAVLITQWKTQNVVRV